MNERIKRIFETGTIDIKDQSFELHSNIDMKEGAFIQTCLNQIEAINTLEIGCAQGISSLFICDYLSSVKEGNHVIIDPYQSTQWQSIGVKNLDKCDFNFYKLIEQPSELALPQLVADGRQFDFIFIDGWHTFDHTLVDLFYASRLLRRGGVIVIDDVGMEGVRRAVRYFLKYPAYELVDRVSLTSKTKLRHAFEKLKEVMAKITSLFGSKVQREIFNDSFILSDGRLKLDSSMVAIQKNEDDERPWNWYQPF